VAKILLFVQKFKMAAAAIMVLVLVYYFGISASRNSMAIHMPNFVQIYATVIEFSAKNKIQKNDLRHLELIIFFHSVKRSISGGSWLHHCNISFIYVNR